MEQSSFIQIVDMNRFFTGTCERLVNRLSEKVVKSRILPKIQVCSENKNKHKIELENAYQMTIQNAILSKRRIHCTKDPFLLINIPREHF